MVFRVWIWTNVRKSSLGEFFSVEPSCKLHGWRKLQRTRFNECSVTTHAEQIGSARFSAVFLRILIQRISSTQRKKFKKGVTFKIYENITFCPSFQLSEFKRCPCRTWQINLQVRNNPSVCSGAELPCSDTRAWWGQVLCGCMEEPVLPFSAWWQSCTGLKQERDNLQFWAGSHVL